MFLSPAHYENNISAKRQYNTKIKQWKESAKVQLIKNIILSEGKA